MKKVLGLGVIFVSVLVLSGCGSKVTKESLQKQDWMIELTDEADDFGMEMAATFDDTTMTMKPKMTEESSMDSAETAEEIGQALGESILNNMSFDVEYTLEGETIHLKNTLLDLDDDYKVSKDGKKVVFTSEEDEEKQLVLIPAEQQNVADQPE